MFLVWNWTSDLWIVRQWLGHRDWVWNKWNANLPIASVFKITDRGTILKSQYHTRNRLQNKVRIFISDLSTLYRIGNRTGVSHWVDYDSFLYIIYMRVLAIDGGQLQMMSLSLRYPDALRPTPQSAMVILLFYSLLACKIRVESTPFYLGTDFSFSWWGGKDVGMKRKNSIRYQIGGAQVIRVRRRGISEPGFNLAFARLFTHKAFVLLFYNYFFIWLMSIMWRVFNIFTVVLPFYFIIIYGTCRIHPLLLETSTGLVG